MTDIPQNCTWVGGVSPADLPEPALYRPDITQPWQDVEIVSRSGDTFVLREVGKLWPGVFRATLQQVGLPGPILEFRQPFGNDRRAA